MPRFDMTTIGEGQLRYSVPLGAYLERATQLDVNVTGTEANVSSLLSRLGWRCGWITSLPDTPLGRRVGNEYALSGLDMSAVVWSIRHRLAIYYVEFGTPPKGSQVYYDRKDTCFVNMTRDDIDWDYLLDTRLLHISGLSVPLSPSIRAILLEAVDKAKARDIPISFDMNYRSRIWSPAEAAQAIAPFLEAVDILFFARGDAQRMYGIEGSPQETVRQLGELTSASAIVTSLSSDGVIAWDRRVISYRAGEEHPGCRPYWRRRRDGCRCLTWLAARRSIQRAEIWCADRRPQPHALRRCRVHYARRLGRPA